MTHQLVVRNGTVIDGTGAPSRSADVAVDGSRIAAVGDVEGAGRVELDATGRLVLPGWVDVHTHYDGQVTWDPLLSPSCWHGVTTAVMGNCGVGFAPVAPERRDWLIQLMEGVEDIPGTALHEGIRWSWETFPEYLDSLDHLPHAIDVATQVPHGALRAYVMGDRGADHDETPTVDEIAAMGRLAREGMEAGALGFTTSRTQNQRSADGRFTPSLTAQADELLGIARAIGEGGLGVLGAVADFEDVDEEFALLASMAEASGRPLSISTMQVDARPQTWRSILALMEDATERGLQVRGQVAPRAIGVLVGLTSSANPMSSAPSFRSRATLPPPQLAAELRRPEVRRQLLDELAGRSRWRMPWERVFALGDPPQYEQPPAWSLAGRAAEEGTTPEALAYDLLVAGDGTALLYLPFTNWHDGDLEAVREMLVHPLTVPGLGDAGAHCGLICDAGFPTFLLTHWGRDRPSGRLPMEWLIHQQTAAAARLVGLHDRGVLAPGKKADLNVVDFNALRVGTPQVVADLPAGGHRLVQRAAGYRATVVSGEIVMQDGEHTGALPGRLVRGAQSA